MANTRSQALLPAASNTSVQTPTIKQLRAAAKRAKDSEKLRNEQRHRDCFAARKAQEEAAQAQYIASMRYLGTKQICPYRICIRLYCHSMNLTVACRFGPVIDLAGLACHTALGKLAMIVLTSDVLTQELEDIVTNLTIIVTYCYATFWPCVMSEVLPAQLSIDEHGDSGM